MTYRMRPVIGAIILSHFKSGNQEVHLTYWFQKIWCCNWNPGVRKLEIVCWNAETSLSAQLSLPIGNKHSSNMASLSFVLSDLWVIGSDWWSLFHTQNPSCKIVWAMWFFSFLGFAIQRKVHWEEMGMDAKDRSIIKHQVKMKKE